MRRVLLSLAVVSAIWSISSPSYAITIVLSEAAWGTQLPGSDPALVAKDPGTSCMFPSNGNYRAVLRAAADYWQTIYTLPYTITITWGFAYVGGAPGGSWPTHLQASGAGAGLIDRGSMVINSNPVGCWYVDGNVGTFSEYPGSVTSEQIPYHGQPGKMVEVGRYTGTSTSGNSSHQDLFLTAVHEMGHLLGMSNGTYRYTNEVTDGDIDVVTWHVCPGLSWMSSDAHLTFSGNPHMLMYPTVSNGYREWPSQADISTISQLSGWWTTSWGAGGGGVTGVAANNPLNH